MKKFKYISCGALVLLVLSGFLLAGCESNSECEEPVLEDSQLQQEYDSLLADYESLSSESGTAMQDLMDLRADYQSLLDGSQTSELRNPTWQELKTFLEFDQTDSQKYIKNKYDCEGFTISLRDGAWRRGYRCAYIAIGFGEGNTGHALNAFQTEDMGLVRIDNTEHDAVGYVEVGKIYGTISIDGVKREFVDTTGEPDKFWQPLTYTQYDGNLFEYEYYECFTQRRDFYEECIASYNVEVDEYNSAVADFNQDNGTYTYSQIKLWEEKLDEWAENLEQLSQDLGASKLEPMEIVSSIETYWN